MAQTLLQDLLDYLTCCPMGIKLLRIYIDGTNESVDGADDGSATAIVVTGTAPYTYLWSTGATTQSITGLAGGVYTVTVTDARGRIRQASYRVIAAPTTTTTTTTSTSTTTTTSSTTTTTTVAPLPAKFLFQGSSDPLSRANMITAYATGEFDSGTIEASFGVGAPGSTTVSMFHDDGTTFTTEDILVDITNSTVFWNDIIGWLQLNNFYDITLDIGTGQWLINDPTGYTYIEIVKP